MPTRTDVTVVNQAYDTSGNGGRKLVRLSNGWLVAGVYDSTNKQLKLFKSSDNGATWSQMCYIQNGTVDLSRFSLSNKDNFVYVLYVSYDTAGNKYILFNKIDALTVTNTNQFSSSQSIETQTDFGNVSLAINSAGTELHAAWASRNYTYPNSFNIRYAKGTINADGSVTWGSVEGITIYNSTGYDFANPSIILGENDVPIILYEQYGNQKIIWCQIKNPSWLTSNGNRGIIVYDGGSYAQSFPSACVAPSGRIWVAWHGTDATDNLAGNIRVAYSDDGGQTWTVTKITSGNNTNYHSQRPSITVNKDNVVYVVYEYGSTVTTFDVAMQSYNGSWSSRTVIKDSTSNSNINVSTLFDLSLSFTQPLFIYRDAAKVGFYGTWVINTISVTPGYIGQKTSADKNNLLTYSITTDGTMGTITEKINGVTITTRTNPTNGQQFTVSLSQAQWDAIKFGTATLTIEMNGDVWTYTFDKRLNANDDILSAVKGVQDLYDHLNAIKAQLAAAIRAKGGTVNDTDAWSAFVSAIASMANKRWASGKTTVSGGGGSATLTVSGLSFTPSIVIVYMDTNNNDATYYNAIGIYLNTPSLDKTSGIDNGGIFGRYYYNNNATRSESSSVITSNGFSMTTPASSGTQLSWIAFE
jgi:hypothetical protein